MSIIRVGDLFAAECDICGGVLPGCDEFMEAVAERKSAGWRSRKRYGDWEDVCTECQDKEIKKYQLIKED